MNKRQALTTHQLHREFEAPAQLRDAIICFWYDSRDYGDEPSVFEVIPDGSAEIIFHFGSGCSIIHNGQQELLPSPFMVGLLNQPVSFAAKNCLEIIGVRCFPWTVFDVLGLPSDKSRVRLFEHPVAGLQPVLKECLQRGKVEDAITLLQQYFTDARAHVNTDTLLHKAGEALKKAGGTIQVGQVAAAAHATVRTLERKFRESSGFTVKDVAGLMRFEQVRNHLWMHPQTGLAGLAVEMGYTDQAHLSREFKRYSGTTPAAFARKAKKERPLASTDFVAFVQA